MLHRRHAVLVAVPDERPGVRPSCSWRRCWPRRACAPRQGVGPNLFLAKVALDITAKHARDCIGFLDQAEFERTIQTHRPIADIWNIGPGIARRLAKYAVYDLRGVCEMSEATLYREFGVNAEYLIDHARGVEPCTIADIHAYEPASGHSLGNGQVLPCDYWFEEARDVLREMVDQLVLDLVEKRLVAESISLHRGLRAGSRGGRGARRGRARSVFRRRPWTTACERQTRRLPHRRHAPTARSHEPLLEAHAAVPRPVRRDRAQRRAHPPHQRGRRRGAPRGVGHDGPVLGCGKRRPRNVACQQAVLAVKGRFGKNALLRGTSLKEKATARERNEQIGGHDA